MAYFICGIISLIINLIAAAYIVWNYVRRHAQERRGVIEIYDDRRPAFIAFLVLSTAVSVLCCSMLFILGDDSIRKKPVPSQMGTILFIISLTLTYINANASHRRVVINGGLIVCRPRLFIKQRLISINQITSVLLSYNSIIAQNDGNDLFAVSVTSKNIRLFNALIEEHKIPKIFPSSLKSKNRGKLALEKFTVEMPLKYKIAVPLICAAAFAFCALSLKFGDGGFIALLGAFILPPFFFLFLLTALRWRIIVNDDYLQYSPVIGKKRGYLIGDLLLLQSSTFDSRGFCITFYFKSGRKISIPQKFAGIPELLEKLSRHSTTPPKSN